MRSTKRHFLKRLLKSGLESVQGGAGTEPAQLLLVVGVLCLEAFLRAVFMREFDDDAAVGRKGVQVENRDAVLFENRVVDYAKGALTGDWGDVWGSIPKNNGDVQSA